MLDYLALMHILSQPRPNGSAAERQVLHSLQGWLEAQSIPYKIHTFRQYPYFFEAIGAWIILSRTLLAVSMLLRWGWPTLLIALLGLPGGLVDVALNFPLVTWFGARTGRNLVLQFDPPAAPPDQELVFSAHYDSKTELLDHHQRMFFVLRLPLGILLTLVVGLLGPLDHALLARGAAAPATAAYSLGLLTSAGMLFLAWGLGLSLSLGRLRPPSTGAVDNGAACAILLGLAARLQAGELALHRTRLTLALFTSEEVNMQGSRAYVKGRDWPLPAQAVNLEVMAQNGEYVAWERDGNSLSLKPTHAPLNTALAQAVAQVTGQRLRLVGPINSDGASFIQRGIPATTLGTYDQHWVDRGFHHPTDNLERVVLSRLPEGVEILTALVQLMDNR